MPNEPFIRRTAELAPGHRLHWEVFRAGRRVEVHGRYNSGDPELLMIVAGRSVPEAILRAVLAEFTLHQRYRTAARKAQQAGART